MEENNQPSPANPTPAFILHEAPTPTLAPTAKTPFYKQPWLVIVSVIVGASIISAGLAFITGTKTSPAEEQFLTMLETAAQKTKVHYNYELSRPKAPNFPAVYAHSLVEYDSQTHDYGVVYVSDGISASSGRCVDGKEYVSTTNRLPDTLAEAETTIGEDWKPSAAGALGTCDYGKSRFQGSFTDGILPVGLTKDQTKNMVTGLKGRAGVVYTDEGIATYNGKKGRKIGFEVNEAKTGTKHRANIFFYAFRDGPSNKVGANIPDINKMNDNFESRFHDTTPQPELKGFYVIDEETHLPIYSQIVTVAGGIPDFTPTTILSEYSFPDSLNMDVKTPLTKLSKPE